jgi:hypothetical protein
VTDHNIRVIAQSEPTHLVAVQNLTAQLADHAQTIQVLNSRLNDLRTYLRLATAEELSAAVTAGQTKVADGSKDCRCKGEGLERGQSHQKYEEPAP